MGTPVPWWDIVFALGLTVACLFAVWSFMGAVAHHQPTLVAVGIIAGVIVVTSVVLWRSVR